LVIHFTVISHLVIGYFGLSSIETNDLMITSFTP
jgi:hypothetical protein